MAMPYTIPLQLKGPFTVADFQRMDELGLLPEDGRMELLDGMVVEMSPIGPRHAGCVNRLNQLLARAGAGQVTLGVQNPAVLDDRSQPQPDVTVLRYRRDGYATAHPGPDDVLLLIEVMDSSADRDRRIKVPLYARAGIRELWLVDLDADDIEVHREPGPNGYASVRWVARGDRLTPLLLETATLSGSDILG
jgi:hypothetical protein